MDNISLLIILRALFIYFLIERGWTVKKKYKTNDFNSKDLNNVFYIYKNVKS